MLKSRLSTYSTFKNTHKGKSTDLKKYNYNRPTYITITDFMRIQNEINPINAEYENRKKYESKLKMLSDAKSKNWADSLEMKKKNELEMAKKRFIEDELRRRQIDLEEKKFNDIQNDIVIQKAKKMIFDEQDPVKSFNGKLLFCDVLKERDYQKEIKDRKKAINDIIEKQFFENDLKKMNDYDRKMELKKKLEDEKRKELTKIMKDQQKEAKIKIIQDYQEKQVEGQIMKLKMQKAIEEDKKKEEIRQKQKLEMQKEYILSNERLKQAKEKEKEREIEEEKKIEEFAMKKQQRDELKRKVEEQKMKKKQENHQKLIDIQFNNLLKIQKEKQDALNKDIKQKEEQDEKDEQEKIRKRNQILQEIKEHRENTIKEKNEQKLKEKQDDINYIEEFKKQLKYLEESEKNDYINRRKRERDLYDYRRLQTEEKRRVALKDFEQINEDNYKQLQRLEKEDDDFVKYAEMWINEYKQQGKNITPLLLELKRYKKNYSLK